MEFIQATPQGVLCGGKPILLRGMGLGGWLLPEGYMWKLYTKCDRPRRIEAMIEALCGRAYAETFWPNYYSGYITRRDIQLIAAQGCNSVRLPLNARHLYALDAQGHVRLDEAGISSVDHCVEWCRDAGIYVLLDMHAAPGGQTGQNIDDCEHDQPELFQKDSYRRQLAELWTLLAARYAAEPCVMGYDLLNEPLCNLFAQYNDQLLPLYRELIAAIRAVDPRHMIVLEGAHWSTDFRIFDQFTPAEAQQNILLQFHKYWNEPDRESIASYCRTAKRLGAPLYAGETGENNLDWYTTAFPLYEREGIGWCFWSYKKMETENSPVSFAAPAGWKEILAWLDGGAQPAPERARCIFDGLLRSIRQPVLHRAVCGALLRKAPLSLPCEAYDAVHVTQPRVPGVRFRLSDPVSILFCSGRQGTANFHQDAGEPRPESEQLCVLLHTGETLGYRLTLPRYAMKCTLCAAGSGRLEITLGGAHCALPWDSAGFCAQEFLLSGSGGEEFLTLACTAGCLRLSVLRIEEPQAAACIEQTTGQMSDRVCMHWTQPPQPENDAQEKDLINLYPEEQFQTLRGFGGAFTEAAGSVFARLTPPRQQEVLDACFGPDGLGYTLGRCPIDSCDFSLSPYCADDDPDDDSLSSFSLARDEQYILPFVRRAAAAAPTLRLLLSPWSPPAYMKTNRQRRGGGHLLPAYRRRWAGYLCRYLEEYQKRGLQLLGLSVQNEPNAAQLWDSCQYTAQEETEFVRDALAPALRAHGLSALTLTVWDHNKERLLDRVSAICSDPEADRAVGAAGFHWYSGDHFEALALLHRKYPDKQLFFTEGCIEYAHGSADAQLENAQRYAHELIGDLNAGLSAFFDWNLLLDAQGGPNDAENYCDAPLMADPASDTLSYQLSYDYLRHFSHWLRPGSVRIGVTRFSDRVEATAALDSAGTVKAVLLNRGPADIPCFLRLRAKLYPLVLAAQSITTVALPQ